MALIGALLLTVVLSTTLGGLAILAAIERRTAASHALGVELRLAARGALAITAKELGGRDWTEVLSGGRSAYWQRPLMPALDIDVLTATIQRTTMMESSHGADTPVWRVFAHMPWSAVAGHEAAAQTVIWVADDWREEDADPARDGNSLILVRVTAASGVAASWVEGLLARELNGSFRVRHVRAW